MKSTATRRRLFATSVLATPLAMLIAAATPNQGLAQTAPAASDATAAQAAAQPATTTTGAQPVNPASPQSNATTVSGVVVTGSILRHKNFETDAPLTIVTASDLQARGLTTIESAVQNLSDNNSGALPNSFTANGAFAQGASGASLRGLTTNSTLVLIDGLRAAYYPLADDGVRNFVDLNTIPDIIVDRVDVYKDGASSTYGADAIAGVINVITKKSYQGFTGQVEGGWAGQGGAGHVQASALLGHGDLNRDGFNIYLAAEYEHDDILRNRQRGFPYNTSNLSSLCGTSLVDGSKTCRYNNDVNGLQFDGTFFGVGSDIVPVVRPYDATNTTAAGPYQLLNPSAGCGRLTPVTLTAANGVGSSLRGVTLCQQDLIHDYAVISPDDKRFSLDLHIAKTLGPNAQAYVEANYYQNEVYYTGTPTNIRFVTPPAGTVPTYNTGGNNPATTIALPVYVCPAGVGCNATNGTLNPNNPFAAMGEVARIYYRFGDIPQTNDDLAKAYRVAGGISGQFGNDWRYDLNLTGMQEDVTITTGGRLYLPNLLLAVGTGSYNFVNPSQNSQAVRNFVSPLNIQGTSSKLAQAQGTISKDLFTLPGGPLQLGVGAAVRYESIYDPSANPQNGTPIQRFSTINPFGTIGHRDVYSAFFELDAPIVTQLDLSVSGRYDSYSNGLSHFSPKFGAKFKPFDMITFRGTYSEGFRIPSFAETNSTPVTGYITTNAPASCNAAHPGDAYCQNYSLGLTSISNPNLRPETSQNITGGIVLQPLRQLSFSVDYYRIEKKNVIQTADFSPALAAYYAGTAMPAGFSVIPDVVDPNYPNAQARAAYVLTPFENLASLVTDGVDLAATARFHFGRITFTSVGEATYVNSYKVKFPDGSVQSYAGTLGPYNVTSASGTPRWRANWQNTVDFGRASLSATIYYTDGYSETAEDASGAGTAFQCAADAYNTGVPATYVDGTTPVRCNVKPFTDVELHGTFNVTKKVQLYFDIDNLFGAKAPYDPTTYGGYNYNPAWANSGIIGRYFKIGARATF